ncbi:FAD binding domain-containing protein [Pusillimonas sp.]|uniref:FAD binding domain-containing protein n=1 Tax=Pusillimonas sp. TaxID=3040095 RepID=UPI00299FE9F7|nr:FAD binding domain-containing protein [Pusillimonas sp.]MDX3894890.1 FAD binding domain-containing protein [Pusillimonas sp.]
MKPSLFDYERVADPKSAIQLTQRDDIMVKVVAGSQSLGPMLNLRLVQPDLLVDITHVPEFKRVEETTEGLTLGACITHADIEDKRVPDVTHGALPAVARGIAYRAVRNRGTVGGSLVHADPAADWVTSLAAIGATVRIVGPSGDRRIPVEDLMTSVFETDLGPGDLVDSVFIPRLSADARWGHCKINRKTGEFAHAMSVVLKDPARDVCRVVIGAIEAKPIVISDASDYFENNGDIKAHKIEQLFKQAGLIDPVANQIHMTALLRAVQRAQL